MKRQYYSETNERLLTYEEVCAVTQLPKPRCDGMSSRGAFLFP